MRLPISNTETGAQNLSDFDTCLKHQFAMCIQLEAIADALPSSIDTQAAMKFAQSLRSTLRRCHRLEEEIIFPSLLRRDPQLLPILERLRNEHLEDLDNAGDIMDAVGAYIIDFQRRKSEILGYMLRCLFVSLRRHLAFDRDFILPLYLNAAEN